MVETEKKKKENLTLQDLFLGFKGCHVCNRQTVPFGKFPNGHSTYIPETALIFTQGMSVPLNGIK